MDYDKVRAIEKLIKVKRLKWQLETDHKKKRKYYLALQMEIIKLKIEKLQ